MAIPLYTGDVPSLNQSQPEFDTNTQDFIDYIAELAPELNEFAEGLNNLSTTGTSLTSNTVGTGSKTFTTQVGKSFFEGQSLTIARTAAPTNRMFCVVVSYNSGTGELVVTSQSSEGAGTFTDWTITIGFNGVVSNAQLADAYINDLTAVALASGDYLAIADASDANKKKKGLVSDLIGIIYGDVTRAVPVRQTVLSGAVDTNGLPSFGGATGTNTVTASTTLTVTAANGMTNRTGSITNPAWGGLTINGIYYLSLDIDAAGVCTPSYSILAPTYRWGGADVVTNNQFTFNIQEMQGKVGNGAVATQTYRVFVGEVLVAAGVVSTITWYALMGRFESAYTATLPNLATTASANHNIGVLPRFAKAIYECTSAELGYAVGDTADIVANGASLVHPTLSTTNKVIRITGGSTNNGWYVTRQDTGSGLQVTRASWKYKFVAERGW
jgi:hypothetical protein